MSVIIAVLIGVTWLVAMVLNPFLTFYVSWLPAGVAGRAYGPMIFISNDWANPKYRVWHHEHEHVKQFWRIPFLHQLLYAFTKTYRGYAEACAFAAQCNKERTDMAGFARQLQSKYKLDITYEEALTMIRVAAVNVRFEP